MKTIIKNSIESKSPAWYSQYIGAVDSLKAQQIDDKWSGFGKQYSSLKKDLRAFLLEEQGYLCAYCQCRVDLNTQSVIEHVIEKNSAPQLTFDLNNLVVCCTGMRHDQRDKSTNDKREIKKNDHCDVHKNYFYQSNNYKPYCLFISPTSTDCEKIMKMKKDGSIEATDQINSFQQNTIIINDILNLNAPHLKLERRSSLSSSINPKATAAARLNPMADISIPILRRNELLARFSNRSQDGYFRPFAKFMLDAL